MSVVHGSLRRQIVSLQQGGGSTHLPPSSLSRLSCPKKKLSCRGESPKLTAAAGGRGGQQKPKQTTSKLSDKMASLNRKP